MKTPTARMATYAFRHGRQVGSPSCWRSVYKCKTSKYVFKKPVPYGTRNANVDEYETYLILKAMTMPEGVRIAEMFLLSDGTLAAEYIDGVHPGYTGCDSTGHGYSCPGVAGCWLYKVAPLDLMDMHHQNVLIEKDGTIVVIDIDAGFRPIVGMC